MNKVLKRAYADARVGTKNPNIYEIIGEWNKIDYKDGEKKYSLAGWLHLKEGWSEDYLIEVTRNVSFN